MKARCLERVCRGNHLHKCMRCILQSLSALALCAPHHRRRAIGGCAAAPVCALRSCVARAATRAAEPISAQLCVRLRHWALLLRCGTHCDQAEPTPSVDKQHTAAHPLAAANGARATAHTVPPAVSACVHGCAAQRSRDGGGRRGSAGGRAEAAWHGTALARHGMAWTGTGMAWRGHGVEYLDRARRARTPKARERRVAFRPSGGTSIARVLRVQPARRNSDIAGVNTDCHCGHCGHAITASD